MELKRLNICSCVMIRDAFQIKNPFISGTCPNQGEGGGLARLAIQIFHMKNSVPDFKGLGGLKRAGSGVPDFL